MSEASKGRVPPDTIIPFARIKIRCSNGESFDSSPKRIKREGIPAYDKAIFRAFGDFRAAMPVSRYFRAIAQRAHQGYVRGGCSGSPLFGRIFARRGRVSARKVTAASRVVAACGWVGDGAAALSRGSKASGPNVVIVAATPLVKLDEWCRWSAARTGKAGSAEWSRGIEANAWCRALDARNWGRCAIPPKRLHE
jgi:hypothetical protein